MRDVTVAAPAPARAVRPALALPAAASRAVGAALLDPSRPATVLLATRYAVYLRDAAGATVAVTTAGATRVPCGLRLAPGTALPALDRALEAGGFALGGGGVVVGGVRVRVARWWDPVPALRPPAVTDLARWYAELWPAVAAARTGLPPDVTAALGRAAAALDGPAGVAAARALLGRGPGSTPSGDDVVAGFLVAARLLAPAGGSPLWARVGEPVAGYVAAAAGARTTPLSAALLHHAVRGEPLGEFADLLRSAPAGVPDDVALARLLGVGHTSGADLATGLVLATAALLATAAAPGRREGRGLAAVNE